MLYRELRRKLVECTNDADKFALIQEAVENTLIVRVSYVGLKSTQYL